MAATVIDSFQFCADHTANHFRKVYLRHPAYSLTSSAGIAHQCLRADFSHITLVESDRIPQSRPTCLEANPCHSHATCKLVVVILGRRAGRSFDIHQTTSCENSRRHGTSSKVKKAGNSCKCCYSRRETESIFYLLAQFLTTLR